MIDTVQDTLTKSTINVVFLCFFPNYVGDCNWRERMGAARINFFFLVTNLKSLGGLAIASGMSIVGSRPVGMRETKI